MGGTGTQSWDGRRQWGLHFCSELSFRNRLRTLFASLSLIVAPALTQVSDDPVDEEELLQHLETIDTDTDAGREHPADSDSLRISELLFRSVLARTTVHNEMSDIKEKSVVRWTITGEKGGSSYGEVSLRSSPGETQATSMTWQYANGDGTWEVALGDITDRTASGQIELDGPLHLRRIAAISFPFGSTKAFSKPSFLRDAYSVRGLGCRIEPFGGTSIFAVAGIRGDASDGGVARRVGISKQLGDHMRIGASALDFGVGSSVQPTITLSSHGEQRSLDAAVRMDPGGNASTFLRVNAVPVRGLTAEMLGWRKHMENGSTVSEVGTRFEFRWRIATGTFLTVSSAQAVVGHEGSPGRSFRDISLRARITASMRLRAVYRIAKEDIWKDGRFAGRTKREAYLSVHTALSHTLTSTAKVRHAAEQDDGIRSVSASAEGQIRWSWERTAVSFWTGTYESAPGLTLWSSHPGSLFWPVSMALSGSGSYIGISVRTGLWTNLSLGGYGMLIGGDGARKGRVTILANLLI